MKIVQILPELNEGGVEKVTVELNKEFCKNSFTSFVISNGGKLVDQIENDGGKHLKFDVCSKNILTIPFRIFGMKKLLREINPDIIHVRSRVPAWLIYFANKSLNIKVVSTVHGFNSVNFYSEIMIKANAVICVSNSVKDYIKKHYSIVENDTHVVQEGIDLTHFVPEKVDNNFILEFKKKHNLDNSIIVTSVGRITQLKDYETFIKAIKLIKNDKKNIKALIVGGVRDDKQDYLKSLKKQIDELDLSDNIIFTGSQSKIAEIYSLSDVVVSSSKKPESFGRTVAESIAMNTPVVATNHGGVKDIIVKNENGFFFETGDEKELSLRIIDSFNLEFNGYNHISNNFSFEKMFTQTLNIYKKVLN